MPELDNIAIARQLELMGDLLEIQGADKFRFLSYRKAASSIRVWPEQLSVLAENGRLAEVSGVGKKLAVSIGEMLRSGSFPELDAVKAEFPPGLVEVMAVPGVGPKRAHQFYDALGIDSLDSLGAALESGSVARLGGMGEKTVASIRRGLATYVAHRGRMLLGDALPHAELLAEELRSVHGIDQVEIAGSVRRMQETIGDIDILVSASDSTAVMGALRELPSVVEVRDSDPTTMSVRTASGPQAGIRIVRADEFGAALQYFTGSKEHNMHLQQVAERDGLRIDEHGVFGVADGSDGGGEQRLGGATEHEVYGLLGMSVPPPEIRHDTGEIEAARTGDLPRLLELGDIRGDFHAHTTSTDSQATLEENRSKAAELGYEYIAVTDHAYDLRMVGGLSIVQLEEQWACVDALNADGSGQPVILKGIELNIGAEGRVDYGPDVLERFDFCIASLHGGWNEDADTITARLMAAMENPYVDIIGHPTGRIIGRREPLPLDMERVLAKAAATGTIMEINAFPDRLDLKDAHLRQAKKHGVRIAIGCDAHRVEHMSYMRYGVAMARRGWITAGECLNAQPLETVHMWLKRANA